MASHQEPRLNLELAPIGAGGIGGQPVVAAHGGSVADDGTQLAVPMGASS